MKKWIPFIVILCLVVTGVGIGIYCYALPKPIRVADIALEKKYNIKSMRNGLYNYLDSSTGMPSTIVIDLKPNDESYCMFENNFKNFRIVFEHGGVYRTDMIFVVTKMKRGKGRLNATVRQIYNGQIREFQIYTTPDRICLTSTIDYQVTVTSLQETGAPVEEVYRDNSLAMTFLRGEA